MRYQLVPAIQIFFLSVGWANRLFEAFVHVLITSQENNQILVNEIWNFLGERCLIGKSSN